MGMFRLVLFAAFCMSGLAMKTSCELQENAVSSSLLQSKTTKSILLAGETVGSSEGSLSLTSEKVGNVVIQNSSDRALTQRPDFAKLRKMSWPDFAKFQKCSVHDSAGSCGKCLGDSCVHFPEWSLPRLKAHHLKGLGDPCNGDKEHCRGWAGCVGKPKEWRKAYSTIQGLRAAGNEDPVQLFHVDGELTEAVITRLEGLPHVRVYDLKDIINATLRESDVVTPIDGVLLQMETNIRQYRSFACASMAMIVSSFTEVMSIGGDGVYFHDPSKIWDNEVVKSTGAFFVRDRFLPNSGKLCNWLQNRNDDMDGNLDYEGLKTRHPACILDSNMHEQCSNVVFLDKSRHGIDTVLKTLFVLQTQILDGSLLAGPVYGEKDLYWMSCELTGLPCVNSFVEAGAVTIYHSTRGDLYCGNTAHFISYGNDTQVLLSANFDGAFNMADFKGITLPHAERPVCDALCCDAKGGTRDLSLLEADVMRSWVAHCLRAAGDKAEAQEVCTFSVPKVDQVLEMLLLSIVRNQDPDGAPLQRQTVHWRDFTGDVYSLGFHTLLVMAGIGALVFYARVCRELSWYTIGIIASFFIVSPAMLLANKVAATIFPLPMTLLTMQFGFAAVALNVLGKFEGVTGIVVEGLEFGKMRWFSITVATLVLQLLANLMVLKDQPLEVLVCCRSILPVLLIAPDYFLFGSDVPSVKSCALLVMVCACMTGFAEQELTNLNGSQLFWIAAWLTLMLTDGVTVKLIMVKIPMTNWTRAYYFNALGLLPVATFALLIEKPLMYEAMQALHVWEWLVVAMSCVLGVLICYVSFLIRDVFFQSSGALLATSCKWVAILVNTIMWDQHTSPVGTLLVVVCLTLSLGYEAPGKREAPCAEQVSSKENTDPSSVNNIMQEVVDAKAQHAREACN